jgi:hypothetical protein
VSEDPDADLLISGSYLEARLYEESFERDGLQMTFSSWRYPLEDYARAIEDAGLVIERVSPCRIRLPPIGPPHGNARGGFPCFSSSEHSNSRDDHASQSRRRKSGQTRFDPEQRPAFVTELAEKGAGMASGARTLRAPHNAPPWARGGCGRAGADPRATPAARRDRHPGAARPGERVNEIERW